jgi:hypothetical protein
MSREQAARQDAKGDALCLQAVNDVAQMPDRARQAINFRDHQGIAFACEFDGSLKLLTRRDRTDVLAEQFLGSRRFHIPNLRFKTGDLLVSCARRNLRRDAPRQA